ncbi:MAG: arylsulfatase [Verrucomicrobiales bacterium]|nr:arylsulfatase [Verrucomicrobiales bacterium]
MRTLALLFLVANLGFTATAAGKPNIVYILADDLGYNDLGCFGQEQLKTPHIDALAARGMRLTRHYSGSTVCAPSRCVLMTGKHTGNATVRGNGRVLLKPDDIIIPQKLKEVGYATGCFGKWGIGHPPERDEPNRFGFDEFYGYVNMFHAHNFYPEFLIRNGEIEKLNNVLDDPWYLKDDYGLGEPKEGAGVAKIKNDYAPHFITKEALSFIDENAQNPFFLYFALNMPHTNNEAGREPYLNGMEVPGYGEFADEDWPDPEKGFAEMMRIVDDYVGQLVAKLDEHELSENTLIVFSSDNGPHEEGQHLAEFFDSNGHLRGMKRDLFDGGIRVPTIATWPGKIAPGSESDVLSGFQDMFPTFAEVAGFDIPEQLDGVSLIPTLLGKPDEQTHHDFLYWEFLEKGGRKAVTTTKWKAVQLDTLKPDPAPTLLFDLENDPSEMTDVASDHPDVVQKMERWIKESHTPPAP